MGIKDLWQILTPFSERKPLYELQGKTVAIDLSGWVCQAQCITEYQVQPRMYLRNLFFRTCYLLLQDINPVFVLEGKAPTLKYKTISDRNAVPFKGARPRKNTTGEPKECTGRSRFDFTLKKCEEMLVMMGLSCITATGEAEAMCAYLNENGLVDGCISQDSDCFAYGAKVVYRNFSISQQGAAAGTGGSVDVFDITKATKAIDFGRNKVIALALLCGSDYSKGVFGVGKDSVIKLFEMVSDADILGHIEMWKTNRPQISDLSLCTNCTHFGKKSTHSRHGCEYCKTNKGCNVNDGDNQCAQIKNQTQIWNKAIADPNFPDQDLIEEFLVRKDKVQGLNFVWKQPKLTKFVKFAAKYLEWEEIYSFKKLFPVLTRWLVLNTCEVNVPTPDYIKKKRNPKGISSYEIIWNCECFKGLIPTGQMNSQDPLKLFASLEPQHLTEARYPNLVESFIQAKIKPKKAKKEKKPKTTIEKFLVNKCLNESIKHQLNNSFKKHEKVLLNNSIAAESVENYLNDSIKKSLNDSINLDDSLFDNEDDADLSTIIEDIVKRDLPNIVNNKLTELLQSSELHGSFFIEKANPIDMFEISFHNITNVDDNCSDEEEVYVPLYERIKNK